MNICSQRLKVSSLKTNNDSMREVNKTQRILNYDSVISYIVKCEYYFLNILEN